MRSSEFLDDVGRRLQSLIDRLRTITVGMTDEELNHAPGPGRWSPAQIVEHMRIANGAYLAGVERAVEGAPSSCGDPEIRHSFFGKLIIRGAGPQGNAPAPKKLHPGPGPYGRELLAEWVRQHEQALAIVRVCHGHDLSNTWLRNPFLPIIKMNLADCLEILAAHGERHVGQIEALARKTA